ncbi:Adherens junction-associated protein 1, partial [Varanus komodoensis]
MFRLAMDLTSCESLGHSRRPPPSQRPAHPYGFPHGPLWSLRPGHHARSLGLLGSHAFSSLERFKGQRPNMYHSRRLHKATDLLWKSGQPEHFVPAKSDPSLADGNTELQTYLIRRKRYLRAFSKPTLETEVIVWGSTSPLEPLETSTFPGMYESTTSPGLHSLTSTATATAAAATTTTAASTTVQPRGPGPGPGTSRSNPSGVSTVVPPATSDGNRKEVNVPPPKIPGDSSGISIDVHFLVRVHLMCSLLTSDPDQARHSCLGKHVPFTVPRVERKLSKSVLRRRNRIEVLCSFRVTLPPSAVRSADADNLLASPVMVMSSAVHPAAHWGGDARQCFGATSPVVPDKTCSQIMEKTAAGECSLVLLLGGTTPARGLEAQIFPSTPLFSRVSGRNVLSQPCPETLDLEACAGTF